MLMGVGHYKIIGDKKTEKVKTKFINKEQRNTLGAEEQMEVLISF